MNHLLFLIFTLISLSVYAQPVVKSIDEVKGLPAGYVIENFTAIDAYGAQFDLNNALLKGPVVLMFIRGQWCPVCNRHLSNIQDSIQFISNMGARIVVVSPEKPEYLLKSIEKTKSEFTFLYDEHYRISEYFDVNFLPDKKTRRVYNTLLGAKLKESHSDNSEMLPVPATFVINKNSIVTWRQFDPDYKNRASAYEILMALEQLK